MFRTAPQAPAGRGDGELPATVRRAFRQVMAAALLLALTSAALFGWVVFRQQPAVTAYRNALLSTLRAHEAMLDQETALRGYLTTGDAHFLQPYHAGRTELTRADQGLQTLTDHRRLAPLVVAVEVAQARWQDAWADAAASPSTREALTTAPQLNAFLDRGKSLFDGYRRANDALETAVNQAMNDARARVNATVAATGVAEVAIAVFVMVIAMLRRRQVGGYALRREQVALAQSERLRQVLTLAREVAGSLNLRYVLDAVMATSRAVGGFDRVRVWLLDDEATVLTLTVDSGVRRRHGEEETVDVGSGVVGRAAGDARVTTDDGEDPTVAVPMIVGARVVGVIEGRGEGASAPKPDTLEVLEMLAVHAATAIEAARLHGRTTELALIDPLTRLANRRRLEDDLRLEVERVLRYGNPLSIIMIDLDHFKQLNDSHGHQRGDDALQEVARIVTDNLRSTDTGYRYGGEELAVLVRDCAAAAAADLAERLRALIEHRFSGPGGLMVTASFGVAQMAPRGMTVSGLVEAADKALYAAKRDGRNRVVVADLSGGGAAMATSAQDTSPI
jgi:diguanylate cyclase (GGDEF)-like protein